MPGQKDRRKDRQTLFHRTLPASAGGPIKEEHDKSVNMVVLQLPLIVDGNSVHFMKMVGLKVTLNTIMKIFVNTMFHSTMALRATFVKRILT